MRNQEIAKIFNEIVDILEIKGDNPFRVRAYRRAAQNIDGLAKDVAEMSVEDRIQIPGIGADLAEKIREYVNTGGMRSYDKLRSEVLLRLDLNDIYIRKAKELGVPVAVNTDAHVTYQFDFMTYGIGTARRGWVEKKDVLNALGYNALIKRLKSKRRMAGV